MNRLLALSFQKLGYDYDYLVGQEKTFYGNGYVFKGEDRICLALKQLRRAKARIVIIPDFDVDGISAGCVLYAGLSVLGFTVELYEPVPDNGYGFRRSDIDAILSKWPDTTAILTCDVGISEKDAVTYARSRGLLAYVTDHHPEDAKKKKRPDADGIMDPSQLGDGSAFKEVCGAWVAWHLLNLYAKLDGSATEQELCRKLVLFAGFGTCGDMMAMQHDSRAAVKASINEFKALLRADDIDSYFGCPASMLPEKYVAPFENIRMLHYYLADNGKMEPESVTDEDYSFTYVPMFNSVQRMGERIDNVYRLLYIRYPHNSIDRLTLFKWFVDLNNERKTEAAQIFGQLYGSPDQGLAPYIYLVDAKRGLMGLLASKLMERTGVPTLVLRPSTSGPGFSGSGRTPGWFSREGLFNMEGVSCDGHEHAFGAFCAESALPALKARMHERYLSELARHESEPASGADPRPVIGIGERKEYGACDFNISSMDDYDVCMDFAHEIQNFRPFGNGFPMPEFIVRFLPADIKDLVLMGSDKSHLKVVLGYGISLVWFGGASAFSQILEAAGPAGLISLSGIFVINTYGMSTSLQFQVSGKA